MKEIFTKENSKCLTCEHNMTQQQVTVGSQPHEMGTIQTTNKLFTCTLTGMRQTIAQDEKGEWIPCIVECDKYKKKEKH